MKYNIVLRNIIIDSGLSVNEICERCRERGIKLDKARLSRLQNGKIKEPNEKLLRTIAKVCNGDESKLVLEAYLDNAPEEIREAFIEIKTLIYMTTMNIFENEFDEKFIDNMKETISEEPLADFVMSIKDSKLDLSLLEENNLSIKNDELELKIKEPLSIKIEDNGMFPKIIENAHVTLELKTSYDDFEIVAVKIKETEKIIARYVSIKGDKITLIPINNEFKKLMYDIKDVVILGKIEKIITDI